MIGMVRHLVVLTILICVVTAVYFQVSQVYFCGFDDFADVHRAVFEDARDPAGIFTKTHFGTTKYRPFQRGLTYITWHFGGESAIAFRIRNLAFHLLGAAAIYGIVWLLTRAQLAATGAGLLFGLHPLANQSIVAAIWAVTPAYGILFASFFLFIFSLHTSGRWLPPLIGSLVLAWIGLFIYEPVIVVFGFMYGYLFVWWLQKRLIRRAHLIWLISFTALILLVFISIRLTFVAGRSTITPIPMIVRNILMYAAALSMPVDSVFLNSLIGTPLPSEMKISLSFIAKAVLVGLAVLAGLGAVFAVSSSLRARLKTIDWREILFFVLAMGAGLSPYLIFTDHPSETYLYLPAGLYAIIVSLILWKLAGSPRAFVMIVGLLLVIFTSSTWMRNRRVVSCGQIAERILTNLPAANWRSGQFEIKVATPADEPAPKRYGIYRYEGLATIDPKLEGLRSAEMAVQIITRNEQVKVDIVEPMEMTRGCNRPGSCFWIMAQGNVADVATAGATNR